MSDELEQISSNNIATFANGQEAMIAKMAFETVTEISRIAADYAKCKQEQITERERIRAQLKAFTTQILAEKEKYIYGIKKHYEFKQQLFINFQNMMKYSIENKDEKMVEILSDLMLNFYDKGMEELKVLLGSNYNNSIKFIE